MFSFDYPESTIELLLACDADIYWVRSNEPVARALKAANKPFLYYAVPYNEEIMRMADATFAQTDTWRKILENGITRTGINPDGKSFDNAKFIPQTFRDVFDISVRTHPKTLALRKSFNADFVIGFFGRLLPWSYPDAIISLLDELNAELGSVKFVVGAALGKGVKPLPESKHIIEQRFAHGDMPYVYGACDIIIGSFRSNSSEYASSTKVLESCAVGTPIILGEDPSKHEMLGDDYPLYVNKQEFGCEKSDVIKKLIVKLCKDDKFWEDVLIESNQKIQKYSQSNLAIRLEKLFTEIIENHV